VSRLRLAIVVQRYGVEVNGGSETLARRIARLLADEVDVTVVTTCAVDYRTWANHYDPGEHKVEGVRVLRFPVDEPRDPRFDELSAHAYASPADKELGQAWMRAQGPHASRLLEHIRSEGDEYDAFVFFTYLYATTAEGLPFVADRALLVPTVHDEPPLRLRIFDEIFAVPRLLLFSTPEEREVARGRFGVEDERARVVGVGVDEPPATDPAAFRATNGIERPYVLCVGRLDLSKGVGELLEYHAAYRAHTTDGLDLVLLGGGELDLPPAPWLHRLGFVSEQTKHDALAGATVVACPSPYESLSLAQLEAWSHARPTLANAASPVLVGQSRRSGGGLWYRDGDEYAAMLHLLADAEPLADAIGRQGRRFVHSAYSWESVRDRWMEAVADVSRSASEARAPMPRK
jgi:glycosyltransferase involved in cell wall biosynthesis